MTKTFILSIDQGTTSSRAILFDTAGNIVSMAQKELTQYYPHKGWVEHSPSEIWADTLYCLNKLAHDFHEEVSNIVSIGITNQRETTILWNRKTGKAIYPAIVWQDGRTARFCDSLKNDENEKTITQKTGLLLSPYFSASKITWILDNVDGARKMAEDGDIAFGTVDCYLLWKLTKGRVHSTDITNASRTLLFNTREMIWDDELLNMFNIPKSILPDVQDNAYDFGVMDSAIMGRDIPIMGMAGDQHAALIGQACFDDGMIKSTYGTGCFALMNIGDTFRLSDNKLLTTPGYRFDGHMAYALEGSIFVAGAAIQWLRDNLGVIRKAEESETLATSVNDTNGVYFVPAFAGLGAPYWNADVKAAIFGLSRESNAAHITRAALEAQAYQTKDLLNAMISDYGHNMSIIRADGGLVSNDFVCQFIADILQCPIEIPKVSETTALGAAYLAGYQAGIYKSLDDIKETWALNRQFSPTISAEEAHTRYEGWQHAIKTLLG